LENKTMSLNEDDKFAALVPFEIDPVTRERVSPQNLPDYFGDAALVEIAQAYENLELAQTEEAFCQAIAVLVFHARHLAPVEHANLARLIIRPYRRPAGRPPSIKLRAEVIEEARLETLGIMKKSLCSSNHGTNRGANSADLANRFSTSKEVVRRRRRAAKKDVGDQT